MLHFRKVWIRAFAERGEAPGHSSMHQEIVMLRQAMETAMRHGRRDRLPDFSEPYRSSWKISDRAWFSPGIQETLRVCACIQGTGLLPLFDSLSGGQ
jgi:hypothetical protein